MIIYTSGTRAQAHTKLHKSCNEGGKVLADWRGEGSVMLGSQRKLEIGAEKREEGEEEDEEEDENRMMRRKHEDEG